MLRRLRPMLTLYKNFAILLRLVHKYVNLPFRQLCLQNEQFSLILAERFPV